MKKKRFTFTFFLYFICSILLLSLIPVLKAKMPTQTMEVVRSSSETFDQEYIQTLTIILHQFRIMDYKTCAEEIIQHCIDNDFDTIQFSYDVVGYPTQIDGVVYLNETDYENGTPCFSFTYGPKNSSAFLCNIYDNSEQFHLSINEL